MWENIKNIYLLKRVYTLLISVIFLFVVSFFIPMLYFLPWSILLGLAIAFLWDYNKLFTNKKGMQIERELPLKFSNSDKNYIHLKIENNYNFKVKVEIIDEIPIAFQIRDFLIEEQLEKNQTKECSYFLVPKKRGIYPFGKVHAFVSSPMGLLQRRFTFASPTTLSCYASFIQMKKYQMMSVSKSASLTGQNALRKLGTSLEFEQIKPYSPMDDLRWVNWKATAKAQNLMINQYQDQTTLNVYCIVDKARAMQMPFEGLSLLDYAINSTLALSNIVLKKKDKVGFISLAKQIEDHVVPSNKTGQLAKINQQLYDLKTNFEESDFSQLYSFTKTKIPQRSLLVLFTNFESMANLKNQLPYLRSIAKKHALVVVFFENTLIEELSQRTPKNIDEIVDKVLAEKFIFEKQLIQQELVRFGISCIRTKPENLSIQVIDKYLKLKAKASL